LLPTWAFSIQKSLSLLAAGVDEFYRRSSPAPLFFIFQPMDGAQLASTAQGFVAAGDLERFCQAQENLAGKVQAQPTVLEAALSDTALEHRALAPARLSQFIATTAAGAAQIGIALTTITAADGRQLSSQKTVITHA
jgi:hypothetical protein